jgi:hypothetical protein
VHLILLALFAQGVNQAADWIRITPVQADTSAVVKLERSRHPTLVTCREASFTSTGLDVVTESQFTLVLTAVVDRSGQVQRFRVDHKPPLPIDFFATALRDALKDWRYSRLEREQPGEAFETTFTLFKPLGSARTSGCERLKGQQPPPKDVRGGSSSVGPAR